MVPTAMPKSLLVIGSGAIGIEFASFYRNMGAEVTVVEVLDRILPVEDEEISAFARKAFEKQGIKIMTGAKVTKAARRRRQRHRHHRGRRQDQEITVDRVISAVGIVGNIEDIGLEGTGVKVERTHVVIDEFCRTGEPGVYAIGDCAGAPWLAHKASHEGVICVEKIAGSTTCSRCTSDNIPGCTYCRPQIASRRHDGGEGQGGRATRSRSAASRSSATARPSRWASRRAWSRPCSTPRPASCWART